MNIASRLDDAQDAGYGPCMNGEPSRTLFVLVACAFYMMILALSLGAAMLWPEAAGYQWVGSSSWSSTSWASSLWASSLYWGLGSGVFIAAGSALFATRSHAGRRLARMLGDALAGTPWWGVLSLAISAGLAEEALFRGTLWGLTRAVGGEWAALTATSLVFGAAHGFFRGRFLAWSVFALIAGFMLGGLRMVSGGMLAPVVAHVIVDAINIPVVMRLTRGERP
ncbi:MAG: CPBP family intramembrane metalloprotease [Deltaproteobacteria bacterium]|nr:CPBP family intramembrane metalloprotease [Deltaproteobacteria bacterium]